MFQFIAWPQSQRRSLRAVGSLVNEAASLPLGRLVPSGTSGLALVFNAQLTLARRSCFKSCLTTPSPKCFHHSRAESPHKIYTKPVKTEQTPDTSQKKHSQHTVVAREQKRAGKDNKDRGARGGDLKKGRPALFCALRFLGRSLLMVSPSQDVAVLFLPHKARGRSRMSTKAAQKPYSKQSPLTPTVSRGSPGTFSCCERACE